MKKGSKTAAKPNGPELRKDRRSGSGLLGSPKKGGHGGKFTWAGDGYSTVELGRDEIYAVDAKDPNFEEPDLVTADAKDPNFEEPDLVTAD